MYSRPPSTPTVLGLDPRRSPALPTQGTTSLSVLPCHNPYTFWSFERHGFESCGHEALLRAGNQVGKKTRDAAWNRWLVLSEGDRRRFGGTPYPVAHTETTVQTTTIWRPAFTRGSEPDASTAHPKDTIPSKTSHHLALKNLMYQKITSYLQKSYLFPHAEHLTSPEYILGRTAQPKMGDEL